jgi:predicted DsbA family dithiol-disulfide isomerase
MSSQSDGMNTAHIAERAPARALALEFYFDLVCPWCWIGLRQFVQARERLQASHPELQLAVMWRSWLLLPQLPADGVPYQDFYQRRFGSAEALAHRRARIQEAGRGIVPQFEFDRIERMPNSLAAHRLLDYARQHGSVAQVETLLERLFKAYFNEGQDIGSPAVLLALAQEVIKDCPQLDAWLADPAGRRKLLARHGPVDIGGVPALHVAGRSTLGGVTSVDYLHSWLAQAG